MRLLLLIALAAGVTGILAVLFLAGTKGDRGDGFSHVVLPDPKSRLPRTLILIAAVLAAGCVLTANEGPLAVVAHAWIAKLLVAAGMNTDQIGTYVPDVNPLPALLVIAALMLFVAFRPGNAYTHVVGFAISVIAGVAILFAAGAVVGFTIWIHAPAIVTVFSVDIAALFIGLLGFVAVLFRCSMLPRRYRYGAVVSALGPALLLSALVIFAILMGLAGFRLVAGLLKAVFPGSALVVFLIVPVTLVFFQMSLFLFRRKERPGKPVNPRPPIDVIMAAWNEEDQIEGTLSRIQEAAAEYGGKVRVILADDGSTDRTVALATAMNRPGAAEIVVLRCPHRTKGPTLNTALRHASTDIVVRIDADIIVRPDVFNNLPAWFANPNVGCVGAFDLPNLQLKAWYTKGRLFECLYTFGFARLAYERFDANNIPGTFLAFRRAVAVAIGGFGEGMNGEDSDLTFNFGRLGLMSVIDSSIIIYEDVPQKLKEFISQRTRWSRASIHVASRHLPRNLKEFTPRYTIQFRFIYTKLAALIRTITVLEGVAFILSDGRPGTLMIRALLLLAIGFLPQYVLFATVTAAYGFKRELPWLIIWFPFTILRKVSMLNGMYSIPPFRKPGPPEPLPAEEAGKGVVMVK
jgi:cellulose synthase/poly-beta-1,6-N-acetylglucosamine synthase-like glycosyltransferase